jgi:hypothetical protein
VLIAALVMGAAVAWADVDTVVARYNVTGYLEGRYVNIDVHYLDSLGNGAVPYIAQLTEVPDPILSEKAKNALPAPAQVDWEDFRDWNYVNYIAETYVPQNKLTDTAADASER